MSRRTTKQRRAARQRRWLYRDAEERRRWGTFRVWRLARSLPVIREAVAR